MIKDVIIQEIYTFEVAGGTVAGGFSEFVRYRTFSYIEGGL
jgi:hypothetical protein